MTNTVLIPNVMAILLLLVLLLSINRESHTTLLLDTKIFVLMVGCNILQCFGEILAYQIDGVMLPGFHVFNLVVNALLFIVNIIFAFLWVVYAQYKIYEDTETVKVSGKKLVLPALLVVVCAIVNLFVPVFFRITKENHYLRTSLFVIPYLLTYFYLAYGTIFIYRHKKQARKYVFLPAIVFMMPIMIGSIIQFFFYGYSTVWAGVAIAMVAVYVNIQNEICYTDMLSGVYTRIYLYQYLKAVLGKKNINGKLLGILMDIDDFKQINDTYGHLVGDDAIQSAGSILYQISAGGGIVARYGGDEFILLKTIQSEADIEPLLAQIEEAEAEFNKSNLKNYTLYFSKGYTILDMEKDTVDTFLERMDRAMYLAKNKRKRARS